MLRLYLKKLNMTTFAIIAVLVVFSCYTDGFSIFRCPGKVEPSYSAHKEGDALNLTCTLQSYVKSNLTSANLYFVSVYLNRINTNLSGTYKIVDDKSVIFTISNISRETGTTFKCLINDSSITGDTFDTFVGSAIVDIGVPPVPVEVLKIEYRTGTMVVNWCPDVFQEDPVLYKAEWNTTRLNQIENCSLVGRCSCIFCGRFSQHDACVNKSITYFPHRKYNLNIVSRNIYGTRSDKFTILVRPDVI